MTPILSAAVLRTQSDARLGRLARDGHEQAFEAIVERYRRPLHRYVRRLLPEGGRLTFRTQHWRLSMQNSGPGSGTTGEGDGSTSGPGPNSGPDREGDRRPDVPCGREVLVAGARVDEAELQSSPSGAVFTEVELDR